MPAIQEKSEKTAAINAAVFFDCITKHIVNQPQKRPHANGYFAAESARPKEAEPTFYADCV